ncbi:MAG TPA: DUF4173 domain-containing protein [Bacillota bacterium]|nr:DUF4173 domain-containing protein [Bacillota bacterium]
MIDKTAPAEIPQAKAFVPAPRPLFTPDRVDGYAALLAFIVGFLFVRFVLLSWQGVGVTIFTIVYAAFSSLYLMKRGHKLDSESIFWLSILIGTGFSYSLWMSQGLRPWRELFLFLTAVYFVLITTKTTLLGKTSDWLPLDGLHGLIVVPLGNMLAQVRSIAGLRSASDRSKPGRNVPWPVIGGILLSLMALTLIVPLLFAADSGGFARLTEGLTSFIDEMLRVNPELVLQLVLALPVGAYIFALLAGSAHRRGSRSYSSEIMPEVAKQVRILPGVTVLILLATVNAVYILFVLSQIPYFFSAFFGARPAGWEVYSAYARDGFFELLRLSLVNLALLAIANLGGQAHRRNSLPLRLLNSLLSLMTILLVATAMSKMFLYIAVYGLSMRRLLPCLFMLLLAAVCVAIIVWQRKDFSIVRFAAFNGALLLAVLSLTDPDAMVARYNVSRYLNGTLPAFDMAILYRAGPSGVQAAETLLAGTQDAELRPIVHQYLDTQYHEARWPAGTHRDTLQNIIIRRKLQRDGT